VADIVSPNSIWELTWVRFGPSLQQGGASNNLEEWRRRIDGIFRSFFQNKFQI
jgi:hypothetical protein